MRYSLTQKQQKLFLEKVNSFHCVIEINDGELCLFEEDGNGNVTTTFHKDGSVTKTTIEGILEPELQN